MAEATTVVGDVDLASASDAESDQLERELGGDLTQKNDGHEDEDDHEDKLRHEQGVRIGQHRAEIGHGLVYEVEAGIWHEGHSDILGGSRGIGYRENALLRRRYKIPSAEPHLRLKRAKEAEERIDNKGAVQVRYGLVG